jgi:subtilisin
VRPACFLSLRFAVGNEGPLTSRSPGNYDTVLSVGAMDEAGKVASFSSSQKFNRPADPLVPDLVAPGVGILSCIPGGKFAEMDGTSMATPHVAGLAALLRQASPNSSVGQIEQAILDSCRLSAMPQARANRGLPNGPRAFELLTGAPLPVAAAIAPRRARPARAVPKATPATKASRKPAAANRAEPSGRPAAASSRTKPSRKPAPSSRAARAKQK